MDDPIKHLRASLQEQLNDLKIAAADITPIGGVESDPHGCMRREFLLGRIEQAESSLGILNFVANLYPQPTNTK